jgi:hypothetical protein
MLIKVTKIINNITKIRINVFTDYIRKLLVTI